MLYIHGVNYLGYHTSHTNFIPLVVRFKPRMMVLPPQFTK